MKTINYYHESMGYIKRSMGEVRQDLELIKSKFDGVRIYHNPYVPDTLPNIVEIASQAKELGLYVIWVENNDSIQLTEPEWGAYCDKVKADLRFAFGADEFLVGNEISIHNDNSSGYDDNNLPVKIKNLIKECKEYLGCTLGYQDGWWKSGAFHNAKLENIEKIYFTLYESVGDFENELMSIWDKFGNRAGIGEWSTQGTLLQSATDERDWLKQLEVRRSMLELLGIDHSYFCFRDTGVDQNQKGFGLIRSDYDFPHLPWHIF